MKTRVDQLTENDEIVINNMELSFTSILILLSLVCNAQINLIINGTAPLLPDGTEVMLQQSVPYRLRVSNKTYTTKVKGHAFKFTLDVDGSELYYLGVNRHGYRMFLGPGKADINVADTSLNKVSVTGNPTNVDYENYFVQYAPSRLDTEYSNARVAYYDYQSVKGYDTTVANIKWQKVDSLQLLEQKQQLNSCLTWINQHPNSLINTSLLYNQLSYLKPYVSEAEVKQIYRSMPTAVTANVWGRELRYYIDSLFIGAEAPNFSQPDTSGHQQSLSNFRGKYVLIDFWASWCLPCRKEDPNLIKVMNKFGNRNFTILSISVDDERKAWIGAIKQDGLYWTQLSSLDGRQNHAAVKYYANAIPTTYLIDPLGKIVAKNLRGGELDVMLSKLLK